MWKWIDVGIAGVCMISPNLWVLLMDVLPVNSEKSVPNTPLRAFMDDLTLLKGREAADGTLDRLGKLIDEDII